MENFWTSVDAIDGKRMGGWTDEQTSQTESQTWKRDNDRRTGENVSCAGRTTDLPAEEWDAGCFGFAGAGPITGLGTSDSDGKNDIEGDAEGDGMPMVRRG